MTRDSNASPKQPNPAICLVFVVCFGVGATWLLGCLIKYFYRKKNVVSISKNDI